MNFIKIREATLDDLPVLLQFEQEIITIERAFDETLKTDKINYYDLKSMLKNKTACIAVAETEGSIIGSGYAKIIKSKHYLQHEFYSYLGFMFVDEHFRGQGINQSLISFLKDWSISKNIFEVRLDVYAFNNAAVKAYTKAGFKPNLVTMRLDLKKPF